MVDHVCRNDSLLPRIRRDMNTYDPGLGCVTPNSAGDDLKVDLVAEAPYHPGYEDAVIDNHVKNWIEEWLEYRNRHMATAKTIVEFIKNQK